MAATAIFTWAGTTRQRPTWPQAPILPSYRPSTPTRPPNTTEGSTVAQKRKVLHFTLVMLEGQAFGLEYQAELGAYGRTASGQFQTKLKSDKTRDWLDLPCPKMHKDWPEFDSVR